MNSPYIIEDTRDFSIVYKPPKMHTTFKNDSDVNNLKDRTHVKSESEAETLFDWYKNQFDNIKYVKLMHRLDFETHGIVIFAKNENCYNFLKNAQDNGEFIKEYSAVCYCASRSASELPLEGFPPPPNPAQDAPFVIESYFRPYGPGRKLVRPVIEDEKKHKETAKDKNGFYRTEITAINGNVVTARIKRGFRHQIRCHLYWIGLPIVNDPLYTACSEKNLTEKTLALKAHAVNFPDPSANSKKKACKLDFFLSPLQ